MNVKRMFVENIQFVITFLVTMNVTACQVLLTITELAVNMNYKFSRFLINLYYCEQLILMNAVTVRILIVR